MRGGCEFTEEVGPGWWPGTTEVGARVKSEETDVQFPDLEPVAGEDGNPFPLIKPLPPSPSLPPEATAEDELPPLVEDDSDNEGDDDDNDDATPPSLPRSNRANQGVPPLRYNDAYAAGVHFMCPVTVKEALGGDQVDKWGCRNGW